jgi:outer membrane protein assembly factor BamE (lipoprotein component of BamABCDE complex)
VHKAEKIRFVSDRSYRYFFELFERRDGPYPGYLHVVCASVYKERLLRNSKKLVISTYRRHQGVENKIKFGPSNRGTSILRMTKKVSLLGAIWLLTACTATQHVKDVRAEDADRVTVGTVQKEIRLGMSGADVATVLGSPNIVTTDTDRRETWVYDKITSEVAYSESGGSIVGLIFGGSGGGLGVGSTRTGATSTSQRTLTVVIKFDEDKLVRDFSYHTSRF